MDYHLSPKGYIIMRKVTINAIRHAKDKENRIKSDSYITYLSNILTALTLL